MTSSTNGSQRALRRPRGRPPAMSPEALVDRIRRLANGGNGLFRVDHTHAVVYARARRCFGSWAAAVEAAGFDYDRVMNEARGRSIGKRRRRGARGRTRSAPKR